MFVKLCFPLPICLLLQQPHQDHSAFVLHFLAGISHSCLCAQLAVLLNVIASSSDHHDAVVFVSGCHHEHACTTVVQCFAGKIMFYFVAVAITANT